MSIGQKGLRELRQVGLSSCFLEYDAAVQVSRIVFRTEVALCLRQGKCVKMAKT